MKNKKKGILIAGILTALMNTTALATVDQECKTDCTKTSSNHYDFDEIKAPTIEKIMKEINYQSTLEESIKNKDFRTYAMILKANFDEMANETHLTKNQFIKIFVKFTSEHKKGIAEPVIDKPFERVNPHKLEAPTPEKDSKPVMPEASKPIEDIQDYLDKQQKETNRSKF